MWIQVASALGTAGIVAEGKVAMIRGKAKVNLRLVLSKQHALHHLRISSADPHDLPVLHHQVVAMPFPISFFHSMVRPPF
ncbi:hypothetical protein CEQ90_17330 [Lewinellaceae bacterium SD302]|nr:hypothetical protein CEQ90_17330 [Lewinellaceae bacterium SD302]